MALEKLSQTRLINALVLSFDESRVASAWRISRGFEARMPT